MVALFLLSAVFLIIAVAAHSVPASTPVRSVNSALERRLTGATVAFACYGGGGGDCQCDIDNNGDLGVLINVYPGYQCAYPNGACTWDDKSGALQNIFQTNCPSVAPCSSASGCRCPLDLFGDMGVLINQFTGYQCAYTGGACTWDSEGNLQNLQQTNCPTAATKCNFSGSDN